MAKIWFEKCSCGMTPLGVHGYFYSGEMGRCPVPVASVETAEVVLAAAARAYDLTLHEIHDVRGQLAQAGLAAEMGVVEQGMLESLADAVAKSAIFEVMFAWKKDDTEG